MNLAIDVDLTRLITLKTLDGFYYILYKILANCNLSFYAIPATLSKNYLYTIHLTDFIRRTSIVFTLPKFFIC